MPDTVHSPVTQRAIPRRVASTGGFTIFRFDHAEEHEVSDLEAVVGRNFTNPAADGVQIVPAATVILVRDGIEVLMLRRDSKLEFAGGMWVFPGGRVDPGDHDPDRPDDRRAAERRAAAREAAEECDLRVDPSSMVRFSHWTPPPQAHRRYSTAFFIAAAPAGSVTIDDGEIRAHRWASPAAVLDAQRRGEVELAPPTFITLTQLLGGPTDAVDPLLTYWRNQPVEHFATVFAMLDGRPAALYHGDDAYETGVEPDEPTPTGRHRLWLDTGEWHYDRTAPLPEPGSPATLLP
jgi:8-oxo-dGTP pyrophosphatase MutT (NUDIX family)